MNGIIKNQKTILMKQQNILKKKFNLDKCTKYDIVKNKIIASNNYETLMVSKFQIVGTYNINSCIWRWAWSNKNIPCKLSELSKHTIEFGDKDTNYNKVKINGKSHNFNFMVATSYFDKSIKGYLIYKKPKTNLLIYMLLKNCFKPSKTRFKPSKTRFKTRFKPSKTRFKPSKKKIKTSK
tara:strand:- start:462 stop:1001 length:540 start_codon:yes stop_codon:yes gene_type:complete